MKRIISSSEIVGQFERDGKEVEVCATSEADFDEATSKLVVVLDCFLRPVGVREKEAHWPATWLPHRQEARETVSHAEAPEVARDVFHRWVRRVRESFAGVPGPKHEIL